MTWVLIPVSTAPPVVRLTFEPEKPLPFAAALAEATGDITLGARATKALPVAGAALRGTFASFASSAVNPIQRRVSILSYLALIISFWSSTHIAVLAVSRGAGLVTFGVAALSPDWKVFHSSFNRVKVA